MALENPHFASPFTLGRKGAAVVEQDSPGDLEARAFNVVACPVGFREINPEFGVPSLLFRNIPLGLAPIREAVNRWAEIEAEVSETELAVEAALRTVKVLVS